MVEVLLSTKEGACMEVVYYAARANLRRLLSQYPSWTRQQYAQAVGMSLGWVKKWSKRLREAPPEDEAVLQGQSRARKHPSERISQRVVERILELRDQPPEGLGRTPGPKALLYYLPRDAELAASGERLPRSSRTIYRLLREAGRIRRPLPHLGEPMERPAPMSQWQLDAPPACCAPMAFPSKSPSTAMCALSAVRKAAIIRRRWCASVTAWAWPSISATHTSRSKTALWSVIIAAIKKNAWHGSVRRPWRRCEL